MNVSIALENLQKRQREHDKKAHEDILYLPVPERLTHFALHFAKYAARLAQREGRSADLQRTAVDAFIVCLAAFNSLSVRSAELLSEDIRDQQSVTSLGFALRDKENFTEDPSAWYLQQLVLGTGDLARACEYLHHVEPGQYREIMLDSLARIFRASIVILSIASVDLEGAVLDRWKQIEKKRI